PVDSRRSFTIAAVILAIVERPFACPKRDAADGSTPSAARNYLSQSRWPAYDAGQILVVSS
ncbi:MAG: hypothetical protein E6614_36905, partial [Bradyrhizobium sp.]|nr:hypothetical protein [Bradyrhizobium sp.]